MMVPEINTLSSKRMHFMRDLAERPSHSRRIATSLAANRPPAAEAVAVMFNVNLLVCAALLFLAPHAHGQCQSEWSDAFQSEALEGAVAALIVHDDDGDGPHAATVYAGGNFVQYRGATGVNRIARWDGGGWSTVGAGFDNRVYHLVEFEGGSDPVRPWLYAAGIFHYSGGTPIDGFARWTGTDWVSVSADITGRIGALCVHDSDGPGPNPPLLYVYTSTLGFGAWDGTVWTVLDPAARYINALASFDPDGDGPQVPTLAATGSFDTLGGLTVDGLAQWDGSRWQRLYSSDALGYAHGLALAVFDDDGAGPLPPALYIGVSTNENRSRLLRLRAQDWYPRELPPPYLNGTVRGLTVLPSAAGEPGAPASLCVTGDFTAIGSLVLNHVARFDGVRWSALGTGVDRTCLVAVPFDPDGVGPIAPGIIAGGDFASAGDVSSFGVARFSDGAWDQFGSGARRGLSDTGYGCKVIDRDADGPLPPQLFVGGDFEFAGSDPVHQIALWDGTQFSSIGNGLDISPRGMTASYFDPDADGPLATRLIIGGRFRMRINGYTYWHVAQWDGTQWATLGDGLRDPYYYGAVDMLPFDEDGPGGQPPVLVVAGTFYSAGGVPALCIARWNGNTWSAMGEGFHHETYGTGLEPGVNSVRVLDIDGDGPDTSALFAVGTFTHSGSSRVDHIARWTGAEWQAVGGGVSGAVDGFYGPFVFQMEVFDDDGPGPRPPALYVAGEFRRAGDVPVKNVARWDGLQWSPLGEGVDGQIWAMAIFDDDGPGPRPPALYVGGDFHMAGGRAATRIAKWDGVAWYPVGDGMNDDVNMLAVLDMDDDGPEPATLYAVGDFTTANGAVSGRMAAIVACNGVRHTCDLNCDGLTDNSDIDPFVMALLDRPTYQELFPSCGVLNGDTNGDGVLDSGDIDGFVQCLTSP